ncbi:3691_t:CDS:1, partial [Racocetra fulgida]
SFIQKASNHNNNVFETEENKSSIIDIVDYQTLNEKQRIIYNKIESHYENILRDHQIEALKIIVIGTA